MERKERKSVHIVLGPHGDLDRKLTLPPLKNAIKETLRPRGGKIVLFRESSGRTLASSARVRKYVDGGGIPTQTALEILDLDPDKRTIADTELLKIEGKSFDLNLRDRLKLTRDKTFISHRDHMLARFVQKNPGRITFLLEGQEEENITQQDESREMDQINFFNFMHYCDEGEFARAMPHFQEMVAHRSRFIASRDPNMAELIDKALQEEKTKAAVGMMGTAHVFIGQLLEKKGYRVKRIFPEMYDGYFVFDPLIELARKQALLPDKEITEQEWLIAMTKEYILMNTSTRQNQSTIRRIRATTRNMTIEDVNEFEESIRQRGFKEALKEYGIDYELEFKKPSRFHSIFRRK